MRAGMPPHPCLSFYRGDCRLELVLPAESDHTGEDGSAQADIAVTPAVSKQVMGIIQLHHTLFPPATVGQLGEVADENYAVQLASPLGRAALQLNWRLLLCVLFPCMLSGDPVPEGDAASDGEPAPGHVLTNATVEACVTSHVTTHDFDGLREPGMMDRLYFSFVVFLRFFGWRVHDEQRGQLDRHRNWQERYRLLEQGYRTSTFLPRLSRLMGDTMTPAEVATLVKEEAREALLAMPVEPQPPDAFDCYSVALLRILHSFLDVGFLTLAVGLVEFLLEEMASGRLWCLHDLVEKVALPCVEACQDVSVGHKKRLRKKLFKLTHSDSD